MRRLGYARTQPGITMVSNNSERSGEYLLEMSNINKSFPGVKALDNVNLKVRPHSIHALMGENGAGKSTLLKCLFGIYQKDSGSILFQGQEIDFHSAKKPWKTVFQWFIRN
jgi:methyl-galactoside transport system ATP-binding protein